MRKPIKSPLQVAYQRFRAVILTTFVFSFVTNMLLFVSPLYMLQVYDRVLGSRNENTLIMISVIAIFVLFIYGCMEFVRSRLLVRAGIQFDRFLSEALFNRAVRLQLANPNAGAAGILSDGDKVREFMTGAGILTFFDVPWTPVFIAVCFIFHPWLGYLALCGTIIIMILALVNEFATKNRLGDANAAGQGARNFANAALQNAEAIRAMGMETALGDRWKKHHNEMLVAQADASDASGAVLATQKFFRLSLQSAILGLGAYLALQQQISPGIMIAASIMMGRALQPVEQGVGHWKHFVAARQAHARLKSMFDQVGDLPERTRLPEAQGHLAVSNLTSVAPGSRTPVVKSVSFQLEAGQTLAIIGPSGSGKSSLVRNLVGVWPVVAGDVRIDKAELKHWPTDQLGKVMGYLPQEVRLFAGTIAENISRFGEATSEEIVAAAQMAGVHDIILKFPDGYQTEVGENGSQLSGGQRQRVGLARAVFGLPRIIVLDEPNSNLDNEGEVALEAAVRQLKEHGRTVILVTHKTNLLGIADRVLIMRDGSMQAFTTPTELTRKSAPPQSAGSATVPVSNNTVPLKPLGAKGA